MCYGYALEQVREQQSRSFREVPSLLQHKNKNKNHDLVVFYWDDESEDQEVVSFLRKQEMGLEESFQSKDAGVEKN